MKRVYLADEQASLEVAGELADLVSAPLVVYLIGDLGTGKTFFTRGVLQALGYQGAVKSPTYTLVETYEFSQFHIQHFDLYRIADAEELSYIGLDTYFGNNSIVLIEWPMRGMGVLPPADLSLNFSYHKTGRELIVTAQSPRGQQILDNLAL